MVATVLLVGLVIIATATDLAWHKIYNWTTYPGILLALALSALSGWSEPDAASFVGQRQLWGRVGLEESAGGLLLCGLIMLVCFVFFRVGGGDVKLMAMLGAFLGPQQGLEVLLWTFVIGAACSLLILVWRIGAIQLAGRAWRQAAWSLRSKSWVPLADADRAALQPPLYLAPSALAALGVTALRAAGSFDSWLG